MQILSYSPKVEAYVSHDGVYYDISDDITSGSVTRNVDAPSSFTLRLQNPGKKYNGAFSPMDRITIYLTKTERYQVLTGYITEVDRFTLYDQDFYMEGKCSLHRLQATYWDPGLSDSKRMMGVRSSTSEFIDAGIWLSIMNVLTTVGKFPVENVSVGGIPVDVENLARELFEAKKAEYAQALDVTDEFYKMLKTVKTQISIGGGESSGSSGSSGSGGQDYNSANSVQKKIADIARTADNGRIPTTADYCAQFVSLVYQAAGQPYPYGNAIDFWNQWGVSTSKDDIPVGAVVCGSGVGTMGSIYGHVGVYLGDGEVSNNVGSLSIESLESWCSWQTANCQGHVGWIGWCFPNGIDITKL